MLDPRPGQRVVIRFTGPDGQPTDALGTVVAADDSSVDVETKRGTVRIDRTDVLLVHEVPPAPTGPGRLHRIVSAADLRRISASVWTPADLTWLNARNLGAEAREDENDTFVQTGWLLRANGGETRRANSVLPLSDPGLDAAAALDVAEAWYAERGADPIVQIYSAEDSATLAPACADLGALLKERGYVPSGATHLLTGATAEAAAGLHRPSEAALPGLVIEAADTPEDLHFTAWGRPVGSDTHEAYATLVASGEQTQVWSAWAEHADGSRTLVATCRLGISHKWAVITNLVTAPDLRRRGAGRAVVRAALVAAASRGVRSYLVDVEAHNTASLALFDSLGASTAHRSWYATRA